MTLELLGKLNLTTKDIIYAETKGVFLIGTWLSTLNETEFIVSYQ